jgi:hypothetical protein
LLTERPVTQKDLVLLKWQTKTKQKLLSLLLTKLNWTEKRLWLKKPMIVKNDHAVQPQEVVDTKAEAAVAVAIKAEAAAVAVATNVVMTAVAAAVAVAETTTVAVAVAAEKVAVAAVETVGN